MNKERFCYRIHRVCKGNYIRWMNSSEFVIFLNKVNTDTSCTIYHQPYKKCNMKLIFEDIKKCWEEDDKIILSIEIGNSFTSIYCDDVN